MQIDDSGRMAIVYLDHEMARAAGGTYEDTEGLINLPLTVKEIQAVVFFKQIEGEQYRVSLRSKGNIDVGTAGAGVRRRRSQERRRLHGQRRRSTHCRGRWCRSWPEPSTRRETVLSPSRRVPGSPRPDDPGPSLPRPPAVPSISRSSSFAMLPSHGAAVVPRQPEA